MLLNRFAKYIFYNCFIFTFWDKVLKFVFHQLLQEEAHWVRPKFTVFCKSFTVIFFKQSTVEYIFRQEFSFVYIHNKTIFVNSMTLELFQLEANLSCTVRSVTKQKVQKSNWRYRQLLMVHISPNTFLSVMWRPYMDFQFSYNTTFKCFYQSTCNYKE